MLPQYKEIEFTTPTGNTYIYIARKKRKRKRNKLLMAFKRDSFICGIGLLVTGIIALAFFAHIQEDATGGFLLVLMGIGCIVTDYID